MKATPKDNDLGDRRSCQFSEGNFTTSVTIFYKLGLDSVAATNTDVKPVPMVGRHKALNSMFGISCGVTMEIAVSSTVDASASADNDKQSCEIAMRVARVIEPKLPGGS